jgi:hypothetical protein
MYTIQLTKTNQIKNPNTKTTYLNESVEVKTITDKEYDLITSNDTVKFFRRLGGSESLQRGYTCAGYKVYKLTSTSPDKQNRTIREFKFIAK